MDRDSVPEKLYIVTRPGLPPGPQAVQGMHAARRFAAEHAEVEQAWYASSNTIAFVVVPDEAALQDLIDRAVFDEVCVSFFCEPDLEGALTAAAFEPGVRGHRLCGRLDPALRL